MSKEEKKEKNPMDKSDLYNITKFSIMSIAILVLLVGILGSMKIWPFNNFSMNDFVMFIDAYKGMFITLTGSIGIGGIAKNFLKSRGIDPSSFEKQQLPK